MLATTNSVLFGQKYILRIKMKRLLAAFSPEERTDRSKGVVQRVIELPEWREAPCVLLFAPLPFEPDIDLLWQGDALSGKQIAYPRMEGLTMRLYYINSPDELEPTRWGLREPLPRAAREAALDDFGVVLVPGLAFDAAGGRLGRGGGYYDRLLAGRDPAKIRLVGVGFAFQQIEETLPLAAHDVRMDEIVTA